MAKDPSRDTNQSADQTSRLPVDDSKTKIGNYELQQQLGHGGMGAVYAATELASGRPVAVKVLLPKNSQDEQFRKRFLREARAGALLNGPHIVPVIGMLEESGTLYLVMQRIQGGNLQHWLRHHPNCDIDWIISISRQIAQGLAFAHAAGVIHRDIKPSNILLSDDGKTAYIADFGLAMLSQSPDGLTTTGKPLGTPNYMSPEQIRGQGIDHRTDLFSLGCVMYAMVTGESPFSADTIAATTWRIMQYSPPSLDRVDPRVPRFLSQIVTRLLKNDPNERYSSAQEVDEALSQKRESDPDETQIHSDQNSLVIVPRPSRSSSIGMVALSVFTGVIVAVVLTWVLVNSWPSGVAEVPAKPPPGSNVGMPSTPQVPPTTSGTATRAERTWTVSADGPADFRSVRSALVEAGPGDEIKVLDSATYDGPVLIDEPVRLRGIRLTSPLHATLRMSAPAGRLATLTVLGTRDVFIEGFNVEGGYEHHGVYFNGDVAGCSLSGVAVTQLPNAAWANLMLARECRGTAEDPLIIRGCRFPTAKYGIFTGREDTPDAMEAAHLIVDGNEFHGDGTHLEMAHSARHVRIQNNVFRNGNGIRLRLPAPVASGDFTICNNTFFEVNNWLQLEPALAEFDGKAANNLLIALRGPSWPPQLERFTRWKFFNNVVEIPDQTEESLFMPFGQSIRDARLVSRLPGEPGFLRPAPASLAAKAGSGDTMPVHVGAKAPEAN